MVDDETKKAAQVIGKILRAFPGSKIEKPIQQVVDGRDKA